MSISTQYHHYVPRFILKEFADPEAGNRRSDTIHYFDITDRKFSTREIRTTCGIQDLYYDSSDDRNPMRIEVLFSKLECRTSNILIKIRKAVTAERGHVDIFEKDILTLKRFMYLSMRRSDRVRKEFVDPNRPNNHIYQAVFENARSRGQSDDPGRCWLAQLLYLLETTHEDLMLAGELPKDNFVAASYKKFVDDFSLQIWEAADEYEFFLNENLIDFEGDTDEYLGVQENGSGHQLIMMKIETFNHVIMPISPKVAVVFCHEATCWNSPFAAIFHRSKIPFPQNSLLKDAPHKDIVKIDVPSEKRGKKRWPATTSWRVSIGKLLRDHHRVIASYSLSHAQTFIVCHQTAMFERARVELGDFGNERIECWKDQGYRYGEQTMHRSNEPQEKRERPDQSEIDSIIESDLRDCAEISALLATSREPLPKSRDNILKSWKAIRTIKMMGQGETAKGPLGPDGIPTHCKIPFPPLQAALEAAYPPKPPNHRDLNSTNFGYFIFFAMSEQTFVKLIDMIEQKLAELTLAGNFGAIWDSIMGNRTPRVELGPSESDGADDLSVNPCFRSVYRTGGVVEILEWMYEERQDILATFVLRLTESKQPQGHLIRMRGPRT